MYKQLNLFNTDSSPKMVDTNAKKPRTSAKEKNVDPSKAFDERMKRFLHYMEHKGMNEQWIETCSGEIRIIIEALADYYDIVSEKVNGMDGYAKAAWTYRMQRITEIQTKLEESIGYYRDKQLEICMKKKPKKDDDIGEDALVLIAKKAIKDVQVNEGALKGMEEKGEESNGLMKNAISEGSNLIVGTNEK